jgi:hypothetical protein
MKDSEIFSRDPEQWDKESLADAVERLRKITERFRKARETRSKKDLPDETSEED